MTSVGTRTEPSALRTSINEFIATSARTVDGVAAARARCPHQRAIASSADGHMARMSASQLHSDGQAVRVLPSLVGVCAHG
jgi:nitrite reductase/ring-hydroxylating ferredoxin subunit